MRLRLLAFALVFGAACAAKTPPAVFAELGKAEALLRTGCYTCLTEALTIFEKHAAAKKPEPAAQQGAFDALVLLHLREKELGLPQSDKLTRASAFAKATADKQPNVTPQSILDAAALVIGETSGLDPEERSKLTGRARPALKPDNPTRRALDPGVGNNLVATYTSLVIDCEQIELQPINFQAIVDKYNAVPLIEYRIGTCMRGPSNLDKVREADARWTDTMFFEARRARVGSQQAGPDLNKAAELLNGAVEAFPGSFAIALLRADNYYSLAEFERSLADYDGVLAKAPTHRDAMKGRMIDLSYLERYHDAIETATRMIDLGTWHIGDAYYWRAWNKYHLKDYEPAWIDVEEATKRLSNTAVYMLAGLIAYSRNELPTAVDRFDTSFKLDPTNCDAVWMSGLVSVDQKNWPLASPKFSRSMTCFVSARAQAQKELARVDALNRTEAQKARMRATLERQIATAEERSAQSAFNAAQGYALAGQKTLAITHVDVAIAYPRLKEKAEALKAAIEKLPN